jgi:hypothetical protein
MEARFGHDFSDVRIHTDDRAAVSAGVLGALAYTVGRDIAFGAGRYQPETRSGRQLLAHELTHVVQQRPASRPAHGDRLAVDTSDSPAELEARQAGARAAEPGAGPGPLAPGRGGIVVSRADPAAVQLTVHLGVTPHTGLQFFPTDVKDTRVGPVSAQGGLQSAGASQLHVIVGQNLTLRTLARMLLVLWRTATPFTPPLGGPPLAVDVINEDQLAQALLVYNQTYLPVPAMTEWRSGLNLPLPIDIDEGTGVATLHPLLILALAGAFDPAWAPLLNRRATATAAPPAATVTADVTAFLAAEPTPLGRGLHLGAMAVTNPVAELPFVREAFLQLGAASFDVALAFMDNLVNREISILAAQRDGAAILAQIRTALAAAPGVLTAAQRASFDRANLMLGLVAGVAAKPPPTATRARAEKTVTIDTVKLDGSTHNPETDVEIANAIFAQCNVRLAHGVNATATHAETIGWLGGNTDLASSPVCGASTAEQRNMFLGATATFGLTARIRAFFPATFSPLGAARGYSLTPACATGGAAVIRNMAVVRNTGTERSLAHEIGHLLLNTSAHPGGTTNVMVDTRTAPLGETFTDTQCTTIHANA